MIHRQSYKCPQHRIQTIWSVRLSPLGIGASLLKNSFYPVEDQWSEKHHHWWKLAERENLQYPGLLPVIWIGNGIPFYQLRHLVSMTFKILGQVFYKWTSRYYLYHDSIVGKPCPKTIKRLCIFKFACHNGLVRLKLDHVQIANTAYRGYFHKIFPLSVG